MSEEEPVPKKRLARSGKRGRGPAPKPKPSIMALPPRYRAFATGEMDLSEMDIEELRRGQLRDVNGHFTGRPPTNLPLKFYHAMMDEYVRRVRQENLVGVEEAYQTLRNTLISKMAPADAKVKAATQLLDRLEGAVGQKIDIKADVTARWENLLDGKVVVDLGDVPSEIVLEITDQEENES